MNFIQYESAAHAICTLGGIDFLQSLKPGLPADCQLLVNDILEQVFIHTVPTQSKTSGGADTTVVELQEHISKRPANTGKVLGLVIMLL